MASGEQRFVKCVIVGDRTVGKTCLLIRYAMDKYPVEYIPPVFDTYSVDIEVDGTPVSLQLNEGPRIEDREVDRLRPRMTPYQQADVIFLCFSLIDKASFENAKTDWIREIRNHCHVEPVVLVGTKLDLRDNQDTLCRLEEDGQWPITYEEGEQMCRDIGATKYVECSALTPENVKTVFEEGIRAVLFPKEKRRKVSLCLIV